MKPVRKMVTYKVIRGLELNEFYIRPIMHTGQQIMLETMHSACGTRVGGLRIGNMRADSLIERIKDHKCPAQPSLPIATGPSAARLAEAATRRPATTPKEGGKS